MPLPVSGHCSAERMLTVSKEVSSPFPHQEGRQRDLTSGKDVQLGLGLFFFFFFLTSEAWLLLLSLSPKE